MHDPLDWGLGTQIAIDLLTSVDGRITHPIKISNTAGDHDHIPIYFSNPDMIWGNEFPRPRFGQGAFQVSRSQPPKSDSRLSDSVRLHVGFAT